MHAPSLPQVTDHFGRGAAQHGLTKAMLGCSHYGFVSTASLVMLLFYRLYSTLSSLSLSPS